MGNFCCCSLAGTAACATCSNNPSRKGFTNTPYEIITISTPGAQTMGSGGTSSPSPKIHDNQPVPAEKDPWKHRSAGMRCSTCMWWVCKAGRVGRCRRHAPTMNGYPVCYSTDWCGDHKLDETKQE